MIRVARRWKHQHGIRALYVDYLQLVEGTGDRQFERVTQVAKALKKLARDLCIPVIALAQISREAENGSDKRPTLRHLSDSSEIEKTADQVLLLYRDDYYDFESKEKGIVEIIIAKNRHGPTGRIKAAWSEETMRFGDLAHTSDVRVFGSGHRFADVRAGA